MTLILSTAHLAPPLSSERQVALAASRFEVLLRRSLAKWCADRRYRQKLRRVA